MIHIRGKTRSKYGNKKVELDGFKFDSKKEARRYQELRILEKAGEITALLVHPKFPIEVNGHKICTYIADFQYVVTGNKTGYVVEDVKSPPTRTNPTYRIKNKLVLACHGISITEV